MGAHPENQILSDWAWAWGTPFLNVAKSSEVAFVPPFAQKRSVSRASTAPSEEQELPAIALRLTATGEANALAFLLSYSFGVPSERAGFFVVPESSPLAILIADRIFSLTRCLRSSSK